MATFSQQHPYFTPLAFFLVALAIGLYLQRHYDIIPDLEQKATTVNKQTVDAANWKSWQHIKKFPDEGAVWPEPRLAHAACTVKSQEEREQLYVFAGFQGGTSPDTPIKIFNDLWRYDEFHDRWHLVHPGGSDNKKVPAPRLHHTLMVTEDQKQLLLFGGFDGFITNKNHKAIDDGLWIFDLASNTWTQIFDPNEKNRPSARGSHETIIIGHEIFLFGGFAKIGGDFKGADELWKFSMKTKKWTKIEKKSPDQAWPVGRIGFPWVNLPPQSSTLAYLFGGHCPPPQHQCNDEWILDIAALEDDSKPLWKKLQTTGDVPSPRRAGHGDVILGNKIYLYGGLTMKPATKPDEKPTPEIFDDFYELNLDTLVWTKITKGSFGTQTRPPPTFGHTFTQVNDKCVLFGGRQSTYTSPGTNDVWEYFP